MTVTSYYDIYMHVYTDILLMTIYESVFTVFTVINR